MSKLESEMRSEKNVALFVREHTLKRESLRVVLGSCCCHGTGINTERFTDLPARFDSADLSIHKEQMAQMSSTPEQPPSPLVWHQARTREWPEMGAPQPQLAPPPPPPADVGSGPEEGGALVIGSAVATVAAEVSAGWTAVGDRSTAVEEGGGAVVAVVAAETSAGWTETSGGRAE